MTTASYQCFRWMASAQITNKNCKIIFFRVWHAQQNSIRCRHRLQISEVPKISGGVLAYTMQCHHHTTISEMAKQKLACSSSKEQWNNAVRLMMICIWLCYGLDQHQSDLVYQACLCCCSTDLQEAYCQNSAAHLYYMKMMKITLAHVNKQPNAYADVDTCKNIPFLPAGSSVVGEA